MIRPISLAIVALLLWNASSVPAADWLMLGRDPTRNAVSPESGGPIDWDVGMLDAKTGKWKGSRNIRWVAKLGSLTSGDPVVSGGVVWVGTNNMMTDDQYVPDASVLAGFAVENGKLVHRDVSLRMPTGRDLDWPCSPMAGAPLIGGERMWFVNNQAEVVCLDLKPTRARSDAPTTLWKLDLMRELHVSPVGLPMAMGRWSSIAAYRDWIFVVTGNGVDETGQKIPAPDAPSLVCLDRYSGKVVWQDKSPGANILHGQWASPTVITVSATRFRGAGVPPVNRGIGFQPVMGTADRLEACPTYPTDEVQVVVPQGDGWLRAFEPATGKLLWEFDMNDKAAEWGFGGRGTRNSLHAPPVYYDGKLCLASGRHPEQGEGPGRLVCIDPTRRGDISSQLAVDAQGKPLPRRRLQAVIASNGEKAIPNPNSGLVWEYTRDNSTPPVAGRKPASDDFKREFHRCVTGVTIHNDLLFACDLAGILHCLDARTGKPYWAYDLQAYCYAQPLIVGDKLYVADDEGDLAIFPATATPPAKPLFETNFNYPITTSPAFSDGVLYVATNKWLFAIDAAP